MTGQIEGVITPATYPLPAFDGQLALLIDAWLREWRACYGSAHVTEDGVTLGRLMFFRGDIFEQLDHDDSYPTHLRISGRDELTGARKMLQRLLTGNPRALGAIAHHILAERAGKDSDVAA